jgi:8-oxo-dGTP diphosphatase
MAAVRIPEPVAPRLSFRARPGGGSLGDQVGRVAVMNVQAPGYFLGGLPVLALLGDRQQAVDVQAAGLPAGGILPPPMMPSDDELTPVFGEKRPGQIYVDRPSAYAIIADEHGRLAVVQTARGRCFLPGGGIDGAESAEQALRREVWEACGRQVDELAYLCAADEYVEAPDEGLSFLEHGAFYLATMHAAPIGRPESGSTLLWLPSAEAVRRLAPRSHAWVVRYVTWQTPG